MKGYFNGSGYMGWINGEYQLFANDSDYYEAYDEAEKATSER